MSEQQLDIILDGTGYQLDPDVAAKREQYLQGMMAAMEQQRQEWLRHFRHWRQKR